MMISAFLKPQKEILERLIQEHKFRLENDFQNCINSFINLINHQSIKLIQL